LVLLADAAAMLVDSMAAHSSSQYADSVSVSTLRSMVESGAMRAINAVNHAISVDDSQLVRNAFISRSCCSVSRGKVRDATAFCPTLRLMYEEPRRRRISFSMPSTSGSWPVASMTPRRYSHDAARQRREEQRGGAIA